MGYRLYLWLIIAIGTFDLFTNLISYSENAIFPHISWLALPFTFLVGPYLYALIKGGARRSKKGGRLHFLHVVPALMVFAILIPVYALDADPKMELISQPTWQVVYPDLLLTAHLSIYLILSIRLVLGRLKRKRVKAEEFNRLLGIGFSAYTLLIISNQIVLQSKPLLVIANSLLILFLLLCKKRVGTTVKTTGPHIDSGIIDSIERVMQEQRLYLRPELTLSLLANLMDLSTNKISKALNSELSCNYNDYINRYRVNEAIRLLGDERNDRYTFEAISKMAGFGSLTTFNGAFKKETGKTPKQYKV